MMDPSTSRLFDRVFICMKCNARLRTDADKVRAGKVKCRKCGYSGLRAKKRLRKGKGK
ncbi:MAG: 50S ribosomal protein L40e [Candidatus Altiarchaeota archaeon]|nr:50S ribosomal protein L40e [Candidatus Altiarchaeota archaeon]